MSQRGPFPAKDAAFIVYINAAIPHLNTNWARLIPHLPSPPPGPPAPDPRQAQLMALKTQMDFIWPQSQNSDSATATITGQKTTYRAMIEQLMRELFEDVPASWLNDPDREILRLPKRDRTPTRVQPMGYAPKIDVHEIKHFQHTLKFGDPQNPNTKAQPRGQQIETEQFVGAAGLAENQVSFGAAEITGRFLLKVIFTADQVGKTAYYRCCYITNTGKRGLWSAMTSAVIA